jgi:hypothetical protein
MSGLPDLPLTGFTNEESSTVRLTGTSDAPALVPACAQSRVSGSITGSLGSSIRSLESVESMVETSLKLTKKGSLAGVAKEPFEIAPLGFEPRLIESESIVLPLH